MCIYIVVRSRYAWKDATQLLKWSLVGVENRRVLKRPGRYDRRSAVKTERKGQQSYERPDYSIDTDQNLNTGTVGRVCGSRANVAGGPSCEMSST
eukprot:COSAG03_NODE_22873_length_286_cov_0.550802_1_plen_94_part_11